MTGDTLQIYEGWWCEHYSDGNDIMDVGVVILCKYLKDDGVSSTPMIWYNDYEWLMILLRVREWLWYDHMIVLNGNDRVKMWLNTDNSRVLEGLCYDQYSNDLKGLIYE